MRAQILSIGSELILGHLTDTNATFLAQEFVASGVELLHVTQVGDDRPRLARTLRAAMAEADLVVCTGGIGPTDDDLTREAIADAVGETPTVDQQLLAGIREFFAGRGLTMPERNAKQAWLIPSAEALPNPVGTAPGWFVRHNQKLVVAMPGVPREMYRMWRDQALPRLQDRLPARSVRSIAFKTLGIGESAAEQLLSDLVQGANPVVATYAKDDGVHVRVTAVASSETEATELRDAVAADVRRRLRRWIYANDGTTLAAALAALLRRHELMLGLIEQGTGARVGGLLFGDAASADVVHGSLALPRSRVGTAPNAAALASEAQSRFASSLGVGVAANAERRSDGLYTGTVTVALTGAVTAVESFPLRMTLDELHRRSALHAADVLRRGLAAMD